MIPNKFVVLWNDLPTVYDPTSNGFRKTTTIDEVTWWKDKYIPQLVMERFQARFIGTEQYPMHMKVVEIQFRIVDSK